MKPWILVVLGAVVGIIIYKLYLGNKVTNAVTTAVDNAAQRVRILSNNVAKTISKSTCENGGCTWMADPKHANGGWCNCGSYNNY